MQGESSKKKLFGTNGIRGIPNEDLSMEFCLKMGKAIGTYFTGEIIAVARDTRVSGHSIMSSVVSGILSTGKNIIDLGILPTPALQFYCRNHQVYGVMITASHNPPEFNGIKCIDRDGTELSKQNEDRIEDAYYSDRFRTVPWKDIGQIYAYGLGIKDYVGGITEKVSSEKIAKRNYRVAFDAGNGAAYLSTPILLDRLGCSVVSLNCNPDGKFSSRPSEPKEENLVALREVMRTGSFDLGIAHDGDADRAVFFNEKGEFIDGDMSLSLLVGSVVRKGDTVVTPVSSSDMLEEICRSRGVELIRTRVGAPVVSREMIERKARIGGEENGGVIFSDHQFCRDGAMTVALFLNLMAETGRKPSELISELPQYHLYRTSLRLSSDWSSIERTFESKVRRLKTDRTDGFKIHEDSGWVLVRPSGTEPIVRIYGHSRNVEDARSLAEKYRNIIEEIQKSKGFV